MKKGINRAIILIAVVTTIVAIGITAAYMFKNSNSITNIFNKPYVMSEVIETYNAETGVKSSIKSKNTGNISEYLRMKMISYWVDENDNIVGVASEMPEVSYDTTNWLKGSGDTYYYKNVVAVGNSTPELLTSSMTLTSKNVTINGETLTVYQVVEIIPEAVQAQPYSAAETLWNVTINDAVITAVN